MPVVGLIGAGLIGRSWANVFARTDWDVRLWDPDGEVLRRAPSLVAKSLHDLASFTLVESPDEAAARVSVAPSLAAAVSGVDFVQESGPETLEAKIQIFAQLDEAAPRDIVLASSTSAIVPSRFTKDLVGRARCIVAHPVNPPHLVPVVELCAAPWTNEPTKQRAREVYLGIGQIPIVVKKEIEGFILNRLQGALLSEAFRLVSEGYVTPTDLDHTIANGLGLRWSFLGPFATIETNAPGGMADYCARYGGFYARLQEAPAPASVWNPDDWQKVVDAWGRASTREEIAARGIWRDKRLAALMAHKSSQK